MPFQDNLKLPDTAPKVSYLTLDTFKKGVITLIDKSRLPKDALEEADNIFLVEDGQPTPRPGVDWFGVDVGAEIDGFDYFDNGTTIFLVVAAGGSIYFSSDDGATYTVCTGGTYTAGNNVYMLQSGNVLYLTTGVDDILRFDGDASLQVYTTLATPTITSVQETGLTGTDYTVYYKIARVNEVGFSAASASVSEQVVLPRSQWTTGDSVKVTCPAYAGTQTRWDIYYSEDNSNFSYLASLSGTDVEFIDDGTAIPVPSTTAPDVDNSTGPDYEELTNVGSRLYGVRSLSNPQRIGFSGAGNYAGSFSFAYDGGYLDWQEGGKYLPVKVEDYRDGKGTPYATIWCKSADGEGCILQMSLETLTVGDISITVPSAYKLPGSRGTSAPGSVVNVLNDYMFYNSQAFYNLGSRAQFLNLLSTDETSANIRPTVKQIKNAAEDKIASTYFDAKVYFSVPYGTDTNSGTIVYDTERKAWLPKAFTIGFKKFLKYTDNSGVQHLLAVKPGDSQLSEISDGIRGDYGVAFATSLVTGLYPVTRNRFEFQWVEEGEVEFSNPQGDISVELLGIERTRGFSTTNTESVTAVVTNAGWDTFAWDVNVWDDTSEVLDTFSESSVKRYFNVNKEMNAIQWRITTNSLDGSYVLRTLQTWGTDTLAGKPPGWKL